MKRSTPIWLLAAILALAACGKKSTETPNPDTLKLTQVGFNTLPGWDQDHLGQAVAALAKSCDKIVDLPEITTIGRDGLGGIAADWLGPCGALRAVDPSDDASARAYFETWFLPFSAAAGTETQGQFTGYFEDELKGSRTQTPLYKVPLYGRPNDLVSVDLGQFDSSLQGHQIWGRLSGTRLTPYPTRAEIGKGALRDHATPLLWVEDVVDAQILEIQGSGRITLDDGSQMRVGFDGTNGRQFLGIGRILIDQGLLKPDQANMVAIRDWLKAHPDQAAALIDKNPRSIFFRIIKGDGPIGAEGVALSAGRSLAIDPRFIPLGIPIYLSTTEPGGAPLRRLMVAQDTGAAIKGVVRGDFFWGTGDAAFDKAARMNSKGTYYLLLPRQRSGRVAMNVPAANAAIAGRVS